MQFASFKIENNNFNVFYTNLCHLNKIIQVKNDLNIPS